MDAVASVRRHWYKAVMTKLRMGMLAVGLGGLGYVGAAGIAHLVEIHKEHEILWQFVAPIIQQQQARQPATTTTTVPEKR